MKPAPLFPAPHELRFLDSRTTLPRGAALLCTGDAGPGFDEARRVLLEQARRSGLATATSGQDATLRVQLDLRSEPGQAGPEQHELRIDQQGATLVGAGPAGLFRAASSLAQLLQTGAGEDGVQLPHLSLRDWPDVARRGVMVDVSRGRVPRMETLFEWVDLLARWKLNELQLYTEHTFAYRGHERVWEESDPLTGAEIDGLRAYCRARFIELVPNQQSFGHMHRWLVHEPYRRLAECPDGVEHPFAPAREPFSLCPTDPRSLELLGGLYDQLLPHFDSPYVNVGLDETFDLGLGRSAADVKRRGMGRVYLDYLLAVHRLAQERGHRIQFWADVVGAHRELIRELPADSMAMLWGYEDEHDFEPGASALAAAGLDFGLSPGTSAWLSIGGRTASMLANVRNAARTAHACGARECLLTDWGDRGHIEPDCVGKAGWAQAAASFWNTTAGAELPRAELAAALERDAFGAPASGLGELALALGETGARSGATAANGSPLVRVLHADAKRFPPAKLRGLRPRGLDEALEHLQRIEGQLEALRALQDDAWDGRAARVRRELHWVLRVLRSAAHLAQARLATRSLSSLEAILGEFRRHGEEHRALWLATSRPKGLEESLYWLLRPLALRPEPKAATESKLGGA